MRISIRRVAYWDDFKDVRTRDQRCASSTPTARSTRTKLQRTFFIGRQVVRVIVWQAAMTAEWRNGYRIGRIITERSVDQNHVPRSRRCLYTAARLV